jgi:hypothetical protein
MLSAGKISPVLRWRAFFVFGWFWAGVLHGAVPASKPPELAQVGLPDAAEAGRLLEQFRQAGIPGQFFLQFELRALPRRGQERTYQGRLWGGRNEQGAITRVEVTDAAGTTHRLLIQNGPRGAVWRVANGRVVTLGVAELFAPIIPGVEVSAFDLQMPYLYWPDATLEKLSRTVLGRPAHAYLVRAPAAFTSQHPEVTAARAYLDTQFNALVQTELLGQGDRVVKTFAFLGLKKVGEQYVPKMADYRNEITRDKTRLQVTGAALNLKLPPTVFDSARLAEAVPPPPTAEIVRIDP